MSLYFDSFSCIDIYTFTSININQLKRTQPFDFYIFICYNGLFDKGKQNLDKCFCICLLHFVALSQQISQVLLCELITHSLEHSLAVPSMPDSA